MAEIFTKEQFQDRCRITDYDLRLSEGTIASRSASGVVDRNAAFPRVWNGSINVMPYLSDEYRELDALIQQIQSPGYYFDFVPYRRRTPKNYTNQNFSAVTTRGNQSGNTLLLQGLPTAAPRFRFEAGDYVSFAHNGVHRLYVVKTPVTVGATGNVNLTLTTPLNAAPPAGTPVQVVDPRVTCQYDPYSLTGGSEGLDLHSGYQLSFTQAIRAI